MTTNSRKPLADLINPHTGKVYWARPERTDCDKSRAVKTCPECDYTVAFHQSAKTGNWYIVDVHLMDSVQTDPKTGVVTRLYKYDSSAPHFKSCETRQGWKTA